MRLGIVSWAQVLCNQSRMGCQCSSHLVVCLCDGAHWKLPAVSGSNYVHLSLCAIAVHRLHPRHSWPRHCKRLSGSLGQRFGACWPGHSQCDISDGWRHCICHEVVCLCHPRCVQVVFTGDEGCKPMYVRSARKTSMLNVRTLV